MKNKIGLKLWSTNTDFYLNSAIELYKQGVFNFIELYVVTDSLGHLPSWKKVKEEIGIPFVLHAPHFMQNVNLAKAEYFEFNKKAYEEVEEYRKILEAEYTVVHGGIEGGIDETVRQLKIIKPTNMLIENKPYKAPLGDNWLCRGYNPEEIKYVMDEVGCGFCLDIGHAICTANSLAQEPYIYLAEFNKLNPTCYHLSDGEIDSAVDMHLHIGEGSYDFKRIFDIIDNNKNIAIETKKNSKENLDDFKGDVDCLKTLLQDLQRWMI